MPNAIAPPLFVKRDLDGFFGLFIDNLVQLLFIAVLTEALCGFTRELIYGRILPAAAISIVMGNLYYAYLARRLAKREGRDDVTALPYGINTPSVIAYIFLIMAPVFAQNVDAMGREAAGMLAWRIGLIACVGSGLVELLGSSVAHWIRRATPRAALLSALAGIALTFISMDFVLQVFEHPLLAIVPMGIILVQYFSGVRLPLGIPGGLAALLVGTAIGWSLKGLVALPLFESFPEAARNAIAYEAGVLRDGEFIRESMRPVLALPTFIFGDLKEAFGREGLAQAGRYLGIILPMGLFNLIGSLQNIESAEAAGDEYPTGPSLAVNGLGTLLGAAFGSCFPTTIYIGHPGWKDLGARTGYSTLNGIVIAVLCVTGLIRTFSAIVPIESVIGILVWIAIVMTSQAFQTVPKRHAMAVALGLIPALAGWSLLFFKHGVASAGGSFADIGIDNFMPAAHVRGLMALNAGFLIISMGLSAMAVFMIDRRLREAAIWAWIMALLSFFGIIHAWDPNDLNKDFVMGIGAGWTFALAYLIWGIILFALRNRVEPREKAV